MNNPERTVSSIPLEHIWDSEQLLEAMRIRHLSADDINGVIGTGTFVFVVARIGDDLRWIEHSSEPDFWNSDAQYRIVFPDEEIFLDDYPESYCYVASEWSPYANGTLILLERYE